MVAEVAGGAGAPQCRGVSRVTPPSERFIDVGGCRCRVWEKGTGDPIGFLPGFRGMPYWTPFAERLAERHRVIVPSLPGFPGADPGHRALDDTVDWIAMGLDLIETAGLWGADIVAESVGAMLALELAALAPGAVSRLVAVGALGLHDPDAPVRNPYTMHMPEIPSLLAADERAYAKAFTCRETGIDAITEHEIRSYRADEAAARLIWPLADRGLRKRLHRVRAPVLLVWGERDAIVPSSYAERFAARLSGPTSIEIIPGAGHLATIDAPDHVAAAVDGFSSH